MTENTFHFPATAGTQLDTFFTRQKLSGLFLQTPVIPTDVDAAIAFSASALFLEGTLSTIETSVAVNLDRIIVFGAFGEVVVERQGLFIGAGEAITLRVVDKILSPEGVIPELGFPFSIESGVLEIGIALFLFGKRQIFFRAIGAVADPVLGQAPQLGFCFFRMGLQTSTVIGLLVNAETDDELVFGAQLHIVSRFGPGVGIALIFFHAHEGSIFICFRVTVATGQLLFLVFVFFQLGQIVFLHFAHSLFQTFVFGILAQSIIQFVILLHQSLAIDFGLSPISDRSLSP